MPGIKSFQDDIILAQCDMLHPEDYNLCIALFKINKGPEGEYVVWNANKRDGSKCNGSYFPVGFGVQDQDAKVEAYTEFHKRINRMLNQAGVPLIWGMGIKESEDG